MVERLRALAERPLDPRVGRAAIVLATAIFAGLALLGALAGSAHDRAPRARGDRFQPPARSAPPGVATVHMPRPKAAPAKGRGQPRQDPQDVRGSAAARRAARELSAHRALQHVPYNRGSVSIVLTGARDGRALLRVSAPTLSAARRGWRRFLRRYRDRGGTYLSRFDARGGRGG